MTGPRSYSTDLKQGRLDLPANFCFTLLNKKLEKTMEEVQKYVKQNKEIEQEKEKKRKKETEKEKIKV